MTDLEKRIYNTYLKVSRGKQNQPVTYRKKFDGFEETDKGVYTRKLGRFFSKYPHISHTDFFEAPYEVYPDDDKFDLSFYITQKAIKAYTIAVKKRDSQTPDAQIDSIKESLGFIFKYCRDKNISWHDYIHDMSENMNTFVIHIREHKVCVYALFGFQDFDRVVSNIPEELLQFTVGDHLSNIPLLRTRFYSSNKAKKLITEGSAKLSTLLKNKVEVPK